MIALTGNIASGKSTVARLLAEKGAHIIDADVLAREAVRPGSVALQRIADRWGAAVLKRDGSLDRSALRNIVFASPEELEALNAIVHPEVRRLRERELQQAQDAGAKVVVADIPLLFERGMEDEFETIILVEASRGTRLSRLIADRGLARDEAEQMIDAQMPSAQKRAGADIIIDNDGSLEALRERIDEVWRQLTAAVRAGDA